MAPEDRTVGTKNLTVEATDSISVLVYVGAYPLDGHSVQKGRAPGTDWAPGCWQTTTPKYPSLCATEILRRAEEDGVDDVLKERLWDMRNWAGALWHVFRAEDADCIKGFLQKVSDSCRGLCPESIPDGPRNLLPVLLLLGLHPGSSLHVSHSALGFSAETSHKGTPGQGSRFLQCKLLTETCQTHLMSAPPFPLAGVQSPRGGQGDPAGSERPQELLPGCVSAEETAGGVWRERLDPAPIHGGCSAGANRGSIPGQEPSSDSL